MKNALLRSKKYRGFSYIEIVIVVAILGLTTTLMIPFTFSEISKSRLSYHSKDLASVIFTAQQNAYSQIGGSGHGIRFNDDDFDVFDGSSFATAASSYNVQLNYDITFTDIDLVDVVSSSNTNEVVFDRGDFKPDATGTVTLSDGAQTYRITINKEGLVYYERI